MTGIAYRLDRRTALRAAAGLALAGPWLVPLGRRPRAQTLDKVSIQTDWRAQAEHGGYYQAIAAGLYRKAGIECDVRQGGPSLNISQLLLAGRVDMTMSGSFEAFAFVRENAPFFTIASIFQKDPQVLIGHPDTGFDSFEKLKGRPILIGAGGRVTYWPYLRRKYGLSDTQLRPYNYSLAPFLADKNLIQQGFLSSEPYPIAQALGRPPSVLLIADAGYTPYQATIAISRKMAEEKKDLVQRFVDATLEGWAQYLKGGPGVEAANALIKQANPEQTDDRLAYAIKVLNERGIVMSGDALQGGIGAMTDRRWTEFLRLDGGGRRAAAGSRRQSHPYAGIREQGRRKAIGERHVQGERRTRNAARSGEEVRAQRADAAREEHSGPLRLGPAGGAERRGEPEALQAVQGARPVGARRAGGGGWRQPAGGGAGRRQRGAGLHRRALHLPAGLAQPSHDAGDRQSGAAQEVPRTLRRGRDHLGHRHLRAGRGRRSRRHEDQGGQGRHRLGDQRPQDLDQPHRQGRLHHRHGGDRCQPGRARRHHRLPGRQGHQGPGGGARHPHAGRPAHLRGRVRGLPRARDARCWAASARASRPCSFASRCAACRWARGASA